FGGLTQEAFAQKLIDDYKAAGVDPRRVWPQSFDRRDIRYWLANEPAFGRQAVYLEAAEKVADLPSPAALQAFKAEGINIIAPPLFALLEGDATGAIRPSAYARAAQAADLEIVPWSLERSGNIVAGSHDFYYQTIAPAIRREGDVLRVLDVLAQEVGIRAIFSDWPATVAYYANCMGLVPGVPAELSK
ncbi:MAG: glycerophosphodiester phosphodiesterase, partial [Chromatiaceae bacterium]|nr:glycerophosphodiester phosphodiesterase [Chromatiaceae bacterium]MBP8789285.1 glycerophosphodiester phosphodiesterase [Azonexus sp.]